MRQDELEFEDVNSKATNHDELEVVGRNSKAMKRNELCALSIGFLKPDSAGGPHINLAL